VIHMQADLLNTVTAQVAQALPVAVQPGWYY
jgi:hypothetical protein